MTTYKRNHSQYKWDTGLDSDLQFGEETYSDKLVSFTTNLLSNVNRAIERNTAGDVVHGMPLDKVNDFVTTSQELQLFLSDIDKDTKTYKGGKLGTNAIKDLWNISKKVGVDPSVFMYYFQDYVPKESTKSRNLRARINDDGLELVTAADLGYNASVLKYLADKKINLMRDTDNNIYSYNEDYSAYSPLEYLNRDLRLAGKDGSDYGSYIFTDNGKVRYGKYANLDPEDPLQESILTYINSNNEKRKSQYKLFSNFNPYLNYTDENKTVSDFIKRLGAAANLDHSLNNFADVSQMFQGNKHVIAVKKDGTNFNESDFLNGTLKLDPSYTFFFVGDDGALHATNWSDPDIERKIGKYNPEGWGELSNQIGSTLQGLNLGESTITSDQIKEDQLQWTNKILDLLSKPRTKRTTEDIRELEKYGAFDNKKNVLSYIGSLMSEVGLKLDQDHLNKWNNLTKEFRTTDLVLNQVTKIDDEQDRKLKEEAEKAGYSSVADYLDYKEGNLRQPAREGWSASDIVRLSALATDLGSLIWSVSDPEPFSNIIGSGVMGLASTGMNAYADFKDKGVSAEDAWKNLGINLGFDTLGIIPGGQSAKVVKNLARILGRNIPTVLGIINGFSHKEDYQEAFDKLLHNPKDLTVKDYLRLSEIVHVALRGHKTFRGGVRVKPNAEGEKVLASILPAWRGTKQEVKSKFSSLKEGVKNWKNKIKGVKPKTETNTAPDLEDQYKTFLGNTSFREGGKLDRFGEYLKSHK